jgi:hypothetical protein
LLDLIGDRRNVAGLIGAAGGLALTFGGVIGPGWWEITFGLYAAGFLGVQLIAPARAAVEGLALPPVAGLPAALDRLAARVGPQLPAPARRQLDAILATAASIEDRLAAIDTSGIDATPVRQVLGDYVPNTLRAFERIPVPLRARRLPDGAPSPNDQITDQLTLLAGQMDAMVQSMAQGDLDAIQTQGRFLRDRFLTTDPFAITPPGGSADQR